MDASVEAEGEEWELRHDEDSGQAYYVNLRTGESSWEAPNVLAESSIGAANQWTEATDETGRVYYMNMLTMETSWGPPSVTYNSANGPIQVQASPRPCTADQMNQLNALANGGYDDEEEVGPPSNPDPGASRPQLSTSNEAQTPTTVDNDSEWMLLMNETDGLPYYFNHITGECVWEPPAAFLGYRARHNEDSDGCIHREKAAGTGRLKDAHGLKPVTPLRPQTPTVPISTTPEFEDKGYRAIETLSKTPVGSSRELLEHTPTVKSIDTAGSSNSRPSSSSGASARQRMATTRAVTEGGGEVVDTIVGVSEMAEDAIERQSPQLVGLEFAEQDTTQVKDDTEEDPELLWRETMIRDLQFNDMALVIQCLVRCSLSRARVARKRKERHHLNQGYGVLESGSELAARGVGKVVVTAIDMVIGPIHERRLNVRLDPVVLQEGESGHEPTQKDDDVQDVVAVHDMASTDPHVLDEPTALRSTDARLGGDSDHLDESEPNDGERVDSQPSRTTEELVLGFETHDSHELSDDARETNEQDKQVASIAESVRETNSSRLLEDDVPMVSTSTGDNNYTEAEQIRLSTPRTTAPPKVEQQSSPCLVEVSARAQANEAVEEVVEEPRFRESVSELPQTESKEILSNAVHPADALTRHSYVVGEDPVAEVHLITSGALGIGQVDTGSNSFAREVGFDTHIGRRTDDDYAGVTQERRNDVKTPSSRQAGREARSSRRPGCRRAVRQPPSRESRIATAEVTNGRLAILSISSFFRERAPRDQDKPTRSIASTVTSCPTDNGIPRKLLPLHGHVPEIMDPKTSEQRASERNAKLRAAERARAEGKTSWQREVEQWQQVYTKSVAMRSTDMEEARSAELTRRQAAQVKQKQWLHEQVVKAAPAAAATDPSMWTVGHGDRSGAAIQALVQDALQPQGFVKMMLEKRSDEIRRTLGRLELRSRLTGQSDALLEYWKDRLRSFPSSLADGDSISDLYWANLCKKLQRIASTGTNLAQELMTHRSDDSDSILHAAASQGQTDLVGFLVNELHFDVNATDNVITKVTPLHEACQKGHSATIDVLLSHGAHIDAINAQGETPLHVASRLGWTQVVRQLIAAGEAQKKTDSLDTNAVTVTDMERLRVLNALTWEQCFLLRNYKNRRAVNVAVLPTLIEFLTQYANGLGGVDKPRGRIGSATSSAASAVLRCPKAVNVKEKTTRSRPKSASKLNAVLSDTTAPAQLTIHAR